MVIGKRGYDAQPHGESTLEVYMLPPCPWQDALQLQHRLVYEMSAEPRRRAALVLCEHLPIVTVGRQGSHSHIQLDELDRFPIRWTNRGGGCWLHVPGQLVAYPILPLDRPAMGLPRFRA